MAVEGIVSTGPATLVRAVRAVSRWGLLAGVAGILANVLLAVLLTTSADGPYAWPGPANDVVSAVSLLATIPVAAALVAVCGNRPALGAITALAILAMVVMAAATLLFVLGLVPFSATVNGSYVGLIAVFGWIVVASRTGLASGRLPRRLAAYGVILGAVGLAGAVLLTVSIPLPAGSLIHSVVYGAGLLTGIPFALYPVWLIVLAGRLPGHLADDVAR